MVNPDFTKDFKKATKEDWQQQYHFKVVERLNSCKFNLQWVTKAGTDEKFGPFFEIIKRGDTAKVAEFMRASDSKQLIQAVEKNSKKSCLHIASQEGNDRIVAYLIGKGAAVDARDRLLKTPLHMACAAGHTAVTKILLENNADAFEKDSSGRTALHYAACSSAPEQLILLGNDPDLIHMKDHAGRTALHYAVFNESQSSVKMVSQLLHLGADVNSLDNDRRTALHHAAEEGKDKVIPVLLQAGASTGTRDAFTRKTAFELAKNDRTRELMIVYSAPPYLPKQEELEGLNLMGKQMKIEKSYDGLNQQILNNNFGKKSAKQVVQINKAEPEPVQQNDFRTQGFQPLAQYIPPNQPAQLLPFNIKNYQERLAQLLRRVQGFGVQSFQHVKKPYLYTGSWMEHVRSLDDLMLQINGTRSNEAVMKIFNILYPYDQPLPQGLGDEVSAGAFFGTGEIDNLRDCHPDRLRERMEKELNAEENNVLRNN